MLGSTRTHARGRAELYPPLPALGAGELGREAASIPAEETTAAREVVGATLSHPLMSRAREAFAQAVPA